MNSCTIHSNLTKETVDTIFLTRKKLASILVASLWNLQLNGFSDMHFADTSNVINVFDTFVGGIFGNYAK